MFPVICRLGPVTIYSYGLMLAIAVFLCTFLAGRDARKAGIPSEFIFDLAFWTVLSGLLGARLFYVALNFSFFLAHPLEMIMIQNGGLAWQGGLVAALIGGIFFTNKKGLALKSVMDLVAPYVALGQAIGRIGCFLNGCCYGKKVSWGIYFPVHDARLHPTQLYASVGLVLIFFVLKYYQKISKVPGSVFLLYLFLASLLRFGVEFFRADHTIAWAGLSIFQLVCLGILTGTAVTFFVFKKR